MTVNSVRSDSHVATPRMVWAVYHAARAQSVATAGRNAIPRTGLRSDRAHWASGTLSPITATETRYGANKMNGRGITPDTGANASAMRATNHSVTRSERQSRARMNGSPSTAVEPASTGHGLRAVMASRLKRCMSLWVGIRSSAP